jgi:aminoglycoside phosphotransferase (APT) family kinase protein
MAERQRVKEKRRSQLHQHAALFLETGFVTRAVVPAVPEMTGKALKPDWSAEVVRAKGTGRLTLRYELDHIGPVYAKAYSDGLGPASYAAHRHLWEHGFGRGARYRVPEPLRFLPDQNLLLMRPAAGVTLEQLVAEGSPDQILEGARKAARWLAVLHATSMPAAEVEPAVDRIRVIKLGNMLARAAAAMPDESARLLDLLQRIRLLAAAHADAPARVPTHGQYTPASIFIDGHDVTVIDLDRVCLSDPAKDIATFMQRIRKLVRNAGGGAAAADEAAGVFAAEYALHEPENLANLPYYGAFYALKRYVECLRAGRTDPAAAALAGEYLHEFERWADESRLRTETSLTSLDKAHLGSAAPRGGREELGKWVLVTSESDFITNYVTPRLAERPPDPLACEMTIAQDTGTGRLTLRYAFPHGETIFAKLYTDALGAHSYQLQRALWEAGFGEGRPYQVPEPLAFLPEHNLVLMRGVPGTPLGCLLESAPLAELVDGVRCAARWLAALHRSTLRIGTPEADWDSLKLFRVNVRLIKAAAARPDGLDALLDLMNTLKTTIKALPERRITVQTHGRYHHDHVFLGPDATAVIDLDRSRPTDPAKDVAEFLRVLRSACFKKGVDEARTETATRAFLHEYLSLVPEAGSGVSYYWLSFLMLNVLAHMKKAGAADARWQRTLDFYMGEIERARTLRV